MDLGLKASFNKFPAPISIGDESFFLVHGKKGYSLLSAVCPHHGGVIADWGNCFMCPDHGWRFELSAGECVNGPNARMYSTPVVERDGHLFLDGPLP